MRHVEGHFTGVGGLELYHQSWWPDATPRAAVALVHGVGEHSRRYMNVVRPLVEAGYVVFAFDQRGHGASEGPSVHIDSWDEYRTDLGTFLHLVAEQIGEAPLVVYGHSMGSLVVLDYLLQGTDGLAGAIISGIAIEPVGVASPAVIAVAKVLSRIAPRFRISLHIESMALTRDADALEAIRDDPMMTDVATARWGTESLKTVDRVKEGMSAIDIPLLVLHGGDDPLNSPAGAQALYDAASCTDKTLRVYPGVVHEPHNDLGHERVAADVLAWLGRVVAQTTPAEQPVR